ncbi:MAG: hypothetical protein QF895_02880 [SAR86 cluster bacterium]|jgi:hypothetical protein|nr:hypothetical protein [SAR86 cluster bacterium]
MNRDFIFRAANRENGLNYLGYVINVGSPKELIKAVSELGFNANVMEYKKVPLSSKAIAVCLPFRGTAYTNDKNFTLAKDIDSSTFGDEDELETDLDIAFHKFDTSG